MYMPGVAAGTSRPELRDPAREEPLWGRALAPGHVLQPPASTVHIKYTYRPSMHYNHL